MKKLNFKKIFTLDRSVNYTKPKIYNPITIIRDWKIIVSLFAIGLIFISVLAWKIYLSDKIGGGYLTPEIPPANSVMREIDEKSLDAKVLFLENKQAEYLKFKANQPKLVDPAL